MFSNNLSTGAIIGNTFVLTFAPSWWEYHGMNTIFVRNHDRNLSNILPLWIEVESRKRSSTEVFPRPLSSHPFALRYGATFNEEYLREQSSSRNVDRYVYIRRIETVGPGNEVIQQEWGTESRGPRLLMPSLWTLLLCFLLPRRRSALVALYLEHA